MNINPFTDNDVEFVNHLHRLFYYNLQPINFKKKFHGSFTVSKNDRIICIGGVRPIAEAVLLTDLSIPIRDRREALLKVLDISRYITDSAGYDQLHCFARNKSWANQLIRYGFDPINDQSLCLDL